MSQSHRNLLQIENKEVRQEHLIQGSQHAAGEFQIPIDNILSNTITRVSDDSFACVQFFGIDSEEIKKNRLVVFNTKLEEIAAIPCEIKAEEYFREKSFASSSLSLVATPDSPYIIGLYANTLLL